MKKDSSKFLSDKDDKFLSELADKWNRGEITNDSGYKPRGYINSAYARNIEARLPVNNYYKGRITQSTYRPPVKVGRTPPLMTSSKGFKSHSFESGGWDVISKSFSAAEQEALTHRLHESKQHRIANKHDKAIEAFKQGFVLKRDIVGDENAGIPFYEFDSYRSFDHMKHVEGELSDHDKSRQIQVSKQNHNERFQLNNIDYMDRNRRSMTFREFLRYLFSFGSQKSAQRHSRRSAKQQHRYEMDRQYYANRNKARQYKYNRERAYNAELYMRRQQKADNKRKRLNDWNSYYSIRQRKAVR